MSLDATRWAWQQQLPPSQKLVLLSLADRADESHFCYPSVARLQRDTGLHRETIMEAIKQIEQSGAIQVIRSNGSGNKYVLIGVLDRHTSTEKHTGRKNNTGTENHTAPVGKTVLHQYGKPDTNLPITIKEPLTRFDEFWEAYGKKVGKKAATDQWKKLNPDDTLADLIIASSKAIAATREVKFRKDPERWLKGRHWEDELSAPPANDAQAAWRAAMC